MAGNLKVKRTSPASSVVPVAFTSAVTVPPLEVFTVANKDTVAFANGLSTLSRALTVALHSVFFWQDVFVNTKQLKKKAETRSINCFICKDLFTLTNIMKLFHTKNTSALLISLCLLSLCGTAQTLSKETVLITTSLGTIKLKLYEETPQHKQNFLKLAKDGTLDSLLFHRVINHFMIQGGDPLSKRAKPGDSLGHGDLGYTIPPEFHPALIHKKGALAAARESDDINPMFASSASQFYIVKGKTRTPEDLRKYAHRINNTRYTNCGRELIKSREGRTLNEKYNRLKNENKLDSAEIVNNEIEAKLMEEYQKVPEYSFTEQQTKTYTGIGGTPHLDGTYTVFGEVIEGIEIVDKIAAVKTDLRDRPLKDIRMKIKVLE
jgi:peptidylprolyl isomerase